MSHAQRLEACQRERAPSLAVHARRAVAPTCTDLPEVPRGVWTLASQVSYPLPSVLLPRSEYSRPRR